MLIILVSIAISFNTNVDSHNSFTTNQADDQCVETVTLATTTIENEMETELVVVTEITTITIVGENNPTTTLPGGVTEPTDDTSTQPTTNNVNMLPNQSEATCQTVTETYCVTQTNTATTTIYTTIKVVTTVYIPPDTDTATSTPVPTTPLYLNQGNICVDPPITNPTYVTLAHQIVDNEIVWDIEGTNAYTYEIWKDDALFDEGGVIIPADSNPQSQIITSLDGLDPGTYEFELILFDVNGNQIGSTKMTVEVGEDANSSDELTLPFPFMYSLLGVFAVLKVLRRFGKKT